MELDRPQREGCNPAKNDPFGGPFHFPLVGGRTRSAPVPPDDSPIKLCISRPTSFLLLLRLLPLPTPTPPPPPPAPIVPLFGGFLCLRTLLSRLLGNKQCALIK